MEKKEAIHLPELALRGGCLGRFGGMKRMWMYVHKWEMANYQTHRPQQFATHLLDRPMSLLTPGTLVIAIIDYCHRGVRRSSYVVSFINWHIKPDRVRFSHLNRSWTSTTSAFLLSAHYALKPEVVTDCAFQDHT